MNPVPFLWLAAVVGFLLLEASTFSMTSVWFAVGAAAPLPATFSPPGSAAV